MIRQATGLETPSVHLQEQEEQEAGWSQTCSRQVKIVESLEAEGLELNSSASGDHEIAMVAAETASNLRQALLSSNGSPMGSRVGSLALAADQQLVGALDTACNRTCTGTTWLASYLSTMKHAPPEIQALISKVPENETFRFGNGGVQVSHERWRLPTMIGKILFTFWTSVVPVPSLGLLLGRDPF